MGRIIEDGRLRMEDCIGARLFTVHCSQFTEQYRREGEEIEDGGLKIENCQL